MLSLICISKYLQTCLPRIAFANCRQVYIRVNINQNNETVVDLRLCLRPFSSPGLPGLFKCHDVYFFPLAIWIGGSGDEDDLRR